MEKTITEKAQDFYDSMFNGELIHLMDVADGEKKPNKQEKEDYGFEGDYPEDVAQNAIQEMHYGIEKETLYYITLAGGGPAARIKVEVEDGDIVSATLQFQDWFTQWTDAPNQDYRLVERFAGLAGYYNE